MTINLPNDLELSIEAIDQSGRFSSGDEAMAEAARRLLQDWVPENRIDPIFGCMRDDAELIDER